MTSMSSFAASLDLPPKTARFLPPQWRRREETIDKVTLSPAVAHPQTKTEMNNSHRQALALNNQMVL